jgi:hypothetical protein
LNWWERIVKGLILHCEKDILRHGVAKGVYWQIPHEYCFTSFIFKLD